MEPEQQAARDILAMTDELCIPRHEYVSANLREFKHLSFGFYERTQRILEKEGFLWLGDEENLTISQSSGGVRTVIRAMLDREGIIQAGIYHFRPKLLVRILLRLAGGGSCKIIDFETEFSNGHFVTTSNANAASAIKDPKELHTMYMSTKTPALVLLARHRQLIEAYQEQNTAVRPKVMRSLHDIRESQHRQQAMKSAYRKEVGGITQDELRRLSRGNTELTDRIFEEMTNVRADNADEGEE
ncbi:MAG: hypothetical protein EOM12_12645 [Verrucomicrobiae bacterium]|nr:hypothetical protein [Verrucomicrobiae bacterium]